MNVCLISNSDAFIALLLNGFLTMLKVPLKTLTSIALCAAILLVFVTDLPFLIIQKYLPNRIHGNAPATREDLVHGYLFFQQISERLSIIAMASTAAGGYIYINKSKIDGSFVFFKISISSFLLLISLSIYYSYILFTSIGQSVYFMAPNLIFIQHSLAYQASFLFLANIVLLLSMLYCMGDDKK